MKKRFFTMIAKLMAVALAFSVMGPVASTGVYAEDVIAYGNVDNNEAIDASDALLVLKHAAKLELLDEDACIRANVDGEGAVDASDALWVLKYAAKLEDKFPVQNQETEEPSGVPTACPATEEPTDVPPTEVPKYESFPIEVLSAGEIAEVDGTTITFNHPDISTDGVALRNPFAGKDTSEGLAISFWLRSSETISGANYTFRSLFTALRDNNIQAVKFDLEGTRQLATLDGDKLNYWEASNAFIQADEEYFITFVINSDGLDYYVDGYSIGYSGYGGQGESTAAASAMELFSMIGTRLYLGGISTVDGSLNKDGIYNHKVPEGTIISELTGYLGNFAETDVEDLYLAAKEGHNPIPTVAPTSTPAPTAEPTAEPTEEPTEDPTEEPTTAPSDEPEIPDKVTEAPEVTKEPETTDAPVEELLSFSGTVYIASDSIADGYDNRMPEGGTDVVGWGNIFANYFTSDVTVKNEANLGDSTKSYWYDYNGDGTGDGHRYKAVYNNIAKDDYVIICFGHNDGPANREDVPVGANSEEKESYQWYLKYKYIEPALAVDAQPILMTPVVRCFYKGGVFSEENYHLEYAQAMRDLVAEYAENGITIPLIDAQKYTFELYQTLSETEAKAYHATNDTTHYNQAGCERLCEYITAELKKTNLGIKQYIK